MSFNGKVVLVTGGTSGIGRETAIQFAKTGAKVVLAGRRKEQGGAVRNRGARSSTRSSQRVARHTLCKRT